MRHRKLGKKFSRDHKQRQALFKNLIKALIINEEIRTTESKAKVVKRLVDRLISRSKAGTLHARRLIASFLQENRSVNKLIDDLGPRFKNRIGGFTRIIRLSERRGDDAMLVQLELVDKKLTGTHDENKQEKNVKPAKSLPEEKITPSKLKGQPKQ